MHREFEQLLPTARGDSQHVIALNVDIRSFSSFSERVESAQAALYIKKFYIALLDRYFQDATFFKPTGDGMLLIYAFEESELHTLSRSLVATSIKAVKDFPTVLRDDPSINFEVPTRLGIGLARGAASRLVSDDKTLDYSGRILNLASRLMDFARPEGVVFDESFRIDLLTPAKQKAFTKDAVFVRGITTTDPLTIYHTSDVLIQPSARTSPEEAWETVDVSVLDTFKTLRSTGSTTFRIPLPSTPIDPATLTGRASFPAVRTNGTRNPGLNSYVDFDVTHVPLAGESAGEFDVPDLVEKLASFGVKPTWPVEIELHYRKS